MEFKTTKFFISSTDLTPPPDTENKTILGRGANGVVYEAIWSDISVAVKTVPLPKMLPDAKAQDNDGCWSSVESAKVLLSKDFYQESHVMFEINHPRIIRLYRICVTDKSISFVMERAVQSLHQFLLTKGKSLTFRERLQIARQIASGMKVLHESHIIHRDLKSPNILLKDNGSWALTDFGMSKVKEAHIASMRTSNVFGTVQWNAPEVFEDQKYSEFSDVYSYGMILYELLTGEIPWKGLNETKIIANVVKEKRPEIQKSTVDEKWTGLVGLMKKCWAQESKTRPSFSEILSEVDSLLVAERPSQDPSRSPSISPSRQPPIELAHSYRKGHQVYQDHKEALRLYKLSAVQDAEAEAWVAYYYITGEGGIPSNGEEGFRLSKLGVEKGEPMAYANLGYCYCNGIGVTEDLKEGIRWLERGVELGNCVSQRVLGCFYLEGVGVEMNEEEGVRLYRLAAGQGYAQAQYDLAVCYRQGTGVAKDEKEVVRLFRLAADQGYALAQYDLGVCYANGTGVSKDEKETVRWYRLAANQGNAGAQCRLGNCYRHGIGVEIDEKEGVRLLRLAVDQGDADAQCNLAQCYENGTGVEKDKKEAARLWRLAADQGYFIAQHRLRKLADQDNVSSQKNPSKCIVC